MAEGYGESMNKKQKTNSFASAYLFLVKEGIQEKRFSIMKSYAETNGFNIASEILESVTHIISELDDVQKVLKLYNVDFPLSKIKFVSAQWLYASIKYLVQLISVYLYHLQGTTQWSPEVDTNILKFVGPTKRNAFLVDERDYCLKGCQHLNSINEKNMVFSTCSNESDADVKFDKYNFNKNILERSAPLKHYNGILEEPLAFLSEYWSTCGDENRALAYSKGAAAIKCLPFIVQDVSQIKDIKDLGSSHSFKIIKEVLDTHVCVEVLQKKECSRFKSLKSLSAIYGIGFAQANKLYQNGIKSPDDMMYSWNSLNINDDRVLFGLAFYDDLISGVSKNDAEKIVLFVKNEVSIFCECCHVELAGGFRRGKKYGHDVDILLSCKPDIEKNGLLMKLIKAMEKKCLLIHYRIDKGVYNNKFSTMDNFEKCFCILKYCQTELCLLSEDLPSGAQEIFHYGKLQRPWKAVRVDFVLIPDNQWAFALLGWTGSSLFERMLRHYAKSVMGITLTSHGMWNLSGNQLLAFTEEEIFDYLKLRYKPPEFRNF